MSNRESDRPEARVDQERAWRSVEEALRGADPAAPEFPPEADLWPDHLDRRSFLQIVGASLAAAATTACDQPAWIVPYIDEPEHLVAGQPLFFASAMPFRGYARGVVVESNMGRPIKVDGNRLHPATVGRSDPFMQASLLTLWDPQRSKQIMRGPTSSPPGTFIADIENRRQQWETQGGEGLRILTAPFTSPLLADRMRSLLERHPNAQWHQWEPVSRWEMYRGTAIAFGRPLEVIYDFRGADVIVSLDADFLYGDPGSVRYARDFGDRRRVVGAESPSMNRLYVAEPMPTVTGTTADHRLAARSSRIGHLASAIASAVGLAAGPATALTERERRWVAAVADDLVRSGGRAIVIAGEQQPGEVQALTFAINSQLGNLGRTVFFTEPVVVNPVHPVASLRQLVADIDRGRVDSLVIIESNPAWTAPADVPFAAALDRVPWSVHLSLYEDETSKLATWHVPARHYLESWGDVRAFDGTATIIQPLIDPLYGGWTADTLLAAVSGESSDPYERVHRFWLERLGSEDAWKAALHRGFIPDSTAELISVGPPSLPPLSLPEARHPLEIVIRPDPSVWDGEYSPNGWLQELPKPVTKLTWGNAALVSPRTADAAGLANQQVVSIESEGRRVEAPVWIVPGHADDAITLHLGYGRPLFPHEGVVVGFDAYRLQSSGSPFWLPAVDIARTEATVQLASTQDHWTMEGRNLARAGTLETFRRGPDFAKRPERTPPVDHTLYPLYDYPTYAWGMAIDLNTCIGCNACVVACQAENNIPVVGRSQVIAGREMHWLRIDRYFVGSIDEPSFRHQPVLCMHCEKAPCEYVCPVAATVHSPEGLNEMIYNRCVGTRYCSNNCPYKVRRFNFLDYTEGEASEALGLMRNPEVSVRSRGVMEKCTYCVQRIVNARIEARGEGRRIRDGEVVTACQSACPTDAIVFGDINDRESRVWRLKHDPRDYPLLGHLNTRPRTTYLAKLINANDRLLEE